MPLRAPPVDPVCRFRRGSISARAVDGRAIQVLRKLASETPATERAEARAFCQGRCRQARHVCTACLHGGFLAQAAGLVSGGIKQGAACLTYCKMLSRWHSQRRSPPHFSELCRQAYQNQTTQTFKRN